ncbi:hypothetical protein Sjap_000573 [Stephania japonica]|uniref:NHL repeat-containing protein n=1 Tax=Stephania japonica TaxID=461633 RepID=A0AAP0KJX1_9MAGN
MKISLFFGVFMVLFVTHFVEFKVEAAPTGPLIKHLSSLIKWSTRSSPKAQQTDGNFLQFENGYLVETVVEGNELGVVPYSIRVSREVNSLQLMLPKAILLVFADSRARLVAGSFQGYKGHVDGKPSDARFNYPKGVTMDDKGNVYVADTLNMAIRKIGEAGVTTIAGGKSNIAGYRDGPSEDAKFSSDFDVVYVGRTCSLLVVDRGNAAIRQIALNEEDCDFQYSSISTTDILMVIGAVLVGYISCMIQQGFGPLYFSRMQQVSEAKIQDQTVKEKPIPLENLKDDQDGGWPSFGRLIVDLSKLAIEALGSVFLYLIPFNYKAGGPKNGLTPVRDSLVLPEDKAETPPVQKQRTAVPVPETHDVPHQLPMVLRPPLIVILRTSTTGVNQFLSKTLLCQANTDIQSDKNMQSSMDQERLQLNTAKLVLRAKKSNSSANLVLRVKENNSTANLVPRARKSEPGIVIVREPEKQGVLVKQLLELQPQRRNLWSRSGLTIMNQNMIITTSGANITLMISSISEFSQFLAVSMAYALISVKLCTSSWNC